MAEAMTNPDEKLKNAVENVLADDGFKILTPSSRSAVEALGNCYSSFHCLIVRRSSTSLQRSWYLMLIDVLIHQRK